MTGMDYFWQGKDQSGNVIATPAQGASASAVALGVQSMNTAAGAAYVWDTAYAQGGQAYGIKISGTTSTNPDIRMLADTGGANIANKTWARTSAFSATDKLPGVGGAWTIAIQRYYDSVGGTRAGFLQLREVYFSATQSRLRLYTQTNNTYYDFLDPQGAVAGLISAGQKFVVKWRGVVGSTTAAAATGDGVIQAELYTSANYTQASTPDATISVTNANLLSYPCEAGDLFLSGMAAGDGTVTYGSGYDRMELGRTTQIPMLQTVTPAVDTGSVASIIDPGVFTAPTGAMLSNYRDTDLATVVRSPVATSTLQSTTVLLDRMNPKNTLAVDLKLGKPSGVTGDGTLVVRLYDGTTLKVEKTYDTAAVGIPNPVTFSSTDLAGMSTDTEGKWANVRVLWGVKV